MSIAQGISPARKSDRRRLSSRVTPAGRKRRRLSYWLDGSALLADNSPRCSRSELTGLLLANQAAKAVGRSTVHEFVTSLKNGGPQSHRPTERRSGPKADVRRPVGHHRIACRSVEEARERDIVQVQHQRLCNAFHAVLTPSFYRPGSLYPTERKPCRVSWHLVRDPLVYNSSSLETP